MRDAHTQNIHITGYPTEKNPDLISRIIGASSNAGDLVLDCYSGSGTTLALAGKLGRQWIGVDNSPAAIDATIERLLFGTQPMGDFVNSPAKGETAIVNSLFDDVGNEEVAILPPIVKMDRPEFAFLCETNFQTEHAASIENWCNKLTTCGK